ncbi:hypothetical protein MKK50_15110 [Methylobacterium sp. J-043]|nr:hypothetical protein [Methylobacterium sp. J-043]
MAKKATAFDIPDDERDDGAAQGTATLDVAEQTAKAAAARPAYREGRKNLSFWIDEKAFRAFKAMVAEEGGTMQDYLIKMINTEFARKGRPQIAK